MKYNKRQFKKINDKNLLKKVKKDWVIVSAVTLSILGGFAVSGTIDVHAESNNSDEQHTSESNKSSNDVINTHNNVSQQNNNQNSLHNEKVGSTKQPQPNPQNNDKHVSSAASSVNASSNQNDDNHPYQGMVNQTSKMVKGAMQNDQITQDQKNEAHNGSIDAWNGIHSNDQKQDINNVPTDTDYYKAGYQGTVDAWNKYNDLNQGKGTQPTKNYASSNYQPYGGKNTDYNNPTSVDSDLNSGKFSTNTDQEHQANIPEDPSDNQSYVQNNNQNIKSNANYSTNDYNQSINLDSNNLSNLNLMNPALNSAYNQGFTDFLGYQGTYDAENGRWSGKKINDAISNLDNNSHNAYIQSYNGAQAAIAQQFTNQNTFSYDIANGAKFNPTPVQNASQQYMDGFNDVVHKVNDDKTAFVSNALQINNAINTHYQTASSDQSSLSRSNLYYYGDIENINFLNDISYQDTQLRSSSGLEQYEYIWPESYSPANLTFNGQNHVTDFGGLTYSLQPNNWSKLDDDHATQMTVKNFHTIYGSDYWGSMKLEKTGTLNYSNVTYIGAQFVNAQSANVNINGNLNIFSVGNYNSPWIGSNVPAEGNDGDNYSNSSNVWGNSQQNMEIGRMTIHAGGNYFGSTTGGNAVELGGNLTLEKGSHMKLVPMNNVNNWAEHSLYSPSMGLYLEGRNSKVNLAKGALIEINPTTNDASRGLAEGIYVHAGNINIDGGEFDINDNGPLPTNSNYANYINGSVTADHNGWFKIHGNNLDSSQNSRNNLVEVDGNLVITDEGNLEIHTDGTGPNNLYLLKNTNGFHVDNPGKKVQLQIDNRDGKAGHGNLFTNSITAYFTKYALGYKNGTKDNVPNSPELTPYRVVVVPSGGSNISYTTLDGKNITSNDNAYGAKYLSFNANPMADFNGNIDDKNQTDDTNKLTGSIILKNLPHPAGLGDNGQIEINVNADNNNDIKAIPNSMYLIQNGKRVAVKYFKDNSNLNGYFINVPNSAQNGNLISFCYDLSKTPQNEVTVTTNYFNGVRAQKLSKNGISNGSNSDGSDNVNFPNNPDPSDRLDPSVPDPLTNDDAIRDGSRDGIMDASKGIPNQATATVAYKKYYQQDHKLAETYRDTYDNGYNGYTNGSNDINDYKYDPTKNNSASAEYQNGYNEAFNDYQKGFMDHENGMFNDQSQNKTYQKGNDVAKGVQDTVDGTYTNNNSSTEEQMGHEAFEKGFSEQMSNQKGPTKSNAYAPAYNYGAEVAQGMQDQAKGNYSHMPQNNNGSNYVGYQNGVEASKGIYGALNNHDENDQTSPSYKITYEATIKGMKNQGIDDTDNPLQKYANEFGKAVYNGIHDVETNVNTTDYPKNSVQSNIYEKTAKNFASGEGKITVNDGSVDVNSVGYKAGQAALQGILDGKSGDDSENKYHNPSLQRTVYDNAKRAFNAGLAGNSDNSDAKANQFANQVGMDTKRGMDDFLSDKKSDANYADNVNYQNGYQAAKDGFNGQIPG